MSNMTERPPIMDDKPGQMSYYMFYTLLEKAHKNQEPREHSSVILIFLAVGVIIFVAVTIALGIQLVYCYRTRQIQYIIEMQDAAREKLMTEQSSSAELHSPRDLEQFIVR
uniref:Uncharacterized protein n=1 Tax=Acrobeloides nanus TaxID=290746 RepID=A0A914EMA6_9BILA